jgi:hypothetical protein
MFGRGMNASYSHKQNDSDAFLTLDRPSIIVCDHANGLKAEQEFVAEQQAAGFPQRERPAGIARGIVEQRRRFDFSADGVPDSSAAEPTLESMRLSVDP